MATHDYPATSSSGPDISGTPSAGNYARWTDADTLEARTTAQVLSDIGAPDISGTPVANRIATWSDANTLQGGAAALSVAGALSGVTTLGMAGALSGVTSCAMSSHIVQSSDAYGMISDTSDGSDTKRIRIAGGGNVTSARGAYLEVCGNEYAWPGNLALIAGNVSGAKIRLLTADTERLVVNHDGTVTLHATTLASLVGSMKLDDLATPDDNTDLNASSTRHGLLPKLSNVATEFLTGTGTWATPASPAAVCADAYLASDNNMSSGFSFNSWNTLTGWTSRLDTNSFYTTDDWTIPSGKAGFYLVMFICAFTPGTAGYGLRTQVYVNGAAVTGAAITPGSENSTSVANSIVWQAVLDLEVADVLTAKVRSDNANDPGTIGGSDSTNGRTSFSLVYLGA